MTAAGLADKLSTHVPAALRALLDHAARSAAAQNVAVYLVGGPVRDLILSQPLTDIDLVVAGDAWPVADAFAAATGGKATHHAAFRTATVSLTVDGQPFAIDFVTARRETYPAPAALPMITPSTMRDDLQRRDFTVNAMALQLVPGGVGELLDPFGGAHDLAAGQLRVLHDRSFIDDPTRILRGARFAARFGFALEPHTRTLVDQALAEEMIARTSSQRILNEVWLALEEPSVAAVLAELKGWHALAQVGLVWTADWAGWFAALGGSALAAAEARLAAFGLLVWPLAPADRARFGQRYNLPRAERRILDELPRTLPGVMLAEHPDPVQVEQELGRYSQATIFVLEMAAGHLTTQPLLRLATELQRMAPLLTGDDLHERGLAPGPRYRAVLARARTAQLRGEISTRADALRWLNQQGIGADPTSR